MPHPLFSCIFPKVKSEKRINGLAMTDEIMTIREVALFLRMTEKSLYRYALEGKIPAFKVGGAWRFSKKEIDLWIAKQSQKRA